jgi:cardiolipin synthase
MKTRIKWALAAVALTLVATLVVLNLMPAEPRVDPRVERLYASQSEQFRRDMGAMLGPPIVAGNRVDALQNGDEIFPAMLAAVRSAKRTITFETYIYWSGRIGQAFADALSERARAGVRVHVLLDWVGSQKIEAALIDEMRRAGVEVVMYHPLSWYQLSRLNNRTHRKLLVVDGRIGFTGGVGIADSWLGHAQDPDHWRDSHFRAEGPVVAQMQATFLDNWTRVTGAVLHGADYFPALAPAGDVAAQMFMSSPHGGSESMHLMYLMAVTSAARTIDLETPYFVPDDITVSALIDAVNRGVRVRIIVQGPETDTQWVRFASRSNWGGLLSAGAQIFEYQPTLFHCKLMVVDGEVTSVGSTNFDNRSFRLNDEANLNVYDAAFARSQMQVFERDLERSQRVTYEAWRATPWYKRTFGFFASLLASQL